MSTRKDGQTGATRYWREEDARRALAALARSGLSLREYCRKAGISEKKLRRWMARLEVELPGAAAFREVRVVPAPTAAPDIGIAGEVIIGRYHVRVPLGFDETELRRLIGVVSAC